MSKPTLFCGQGCGAAAVEMLTGVFKAFEEQHITIDKVLASSGSALFTGLYFSKHDSAWFRDLMENKEFTDFVDMKPVQAIKSINGYSNYIYDNTGVFNLLKKEMTGDATRKITVSTTRVADMKSVMFPATPSTVLAATSIPVVFPPTMISGKLYCDGGVKNNIPLPKISQLADFETVYIFLAPATYYSEPKNLLETGLNLLNAIMDREVEQLQEAGYLDHANVKLIRCDSLLSGGLLKWSDNFELREDAYKVAGNVLGVNK